MAPAGRAGYLLAARRTSNAGLRTGPLSAKEDERKRVIRGRWGRRKTKGEVCEEAGGRGKNRRSGSPLCKPGLLLALARACVRFGFTAAVQHRLSGFTAPRPNLIIRDQFVFRSSALLIIIKKKGSYCTEY